MGVDMEKICSCGGRLQFERACFVGTNFFVGSIGEDCDLYICEKCGKMEFYRRSAGSAPSPEEYRAAEMEKRFSGYSVQKLLKIAEDPSYRDDARALARRLAKERE